MELSPGATMAAMLLSGLAFFGLFVFSCTLILLWPRDHNARGAMLAVAMSLFSTFLTLRFGPVALLLILVALLFLMGVVNAHQRSSQV